ncbi:carbonic anhydrase, partial [Colletotrichum sublineola]
MILPSFVSLLLLAPCVLACPEHKNRYEVGDKRRKTSLSDPACDWSYETPLNWGRNNPNYSLCHTGMQQSPISVGLRRYGVAQYKIQWTYNNETKGNFYNWGYGPAFTVIVPKGGYNGGPHFTYRGLTGYLKGWHIHTPAEHIVDGYRAKAELHLVHVDTQGRDNAVLAIRLDPGDTESPFFAQLPPMIGPKDAAKKQTQITVDHTKALDSVLRVLEFWEYQGSLTTPPCGEGIRWFIARPVMPMSMGQMRVILGASTYSARPEQAVWQHNVN